jgi:hypothetical protein
MAYSTAYQTAGMSSTIDAPASPGISSELKELSQTISETQKAASEIRSALGISYPEDNCAEEPDSSMASAIRAMRFELRRANDSLAEAFRHINN